MLRPIQVHADGLDVTPRALKVRAVLALLLLRSGETVELSTILRRVWDTPPPATVVASARNVVLGLRRLLAGHPGVHLDTAPTGYRLVVPPGALDVVEFSTLLARGRAFAAQSDHDRAAAAFRRAVGLWHGPALADLTHHGYVWPEITELAERRLEARELLCRAEIDSGRSQDALVDLAGLIREFPAREELHRLRIVALGRRARRAEASDAYQQARAALGELAGRALLDTYVSVIEPREERDPRTTVLSGPPSPYGPVAQVRRARTPTDTAPRIPQPRSGDDGVHVRKEIRSLVILGLDGPYDLGGSATGGADQAPRPAVNTLIARHGGVPQVRDHSVLIVYFGLHDDVDEPLRDAQDAAVRCALAVRAALATDRLLQGDISGVTRRPPGPGREPAPDPRHLGTSGPASPDHPRARATISAAVTTGCVLHTVRDHPTGGRISWIAGEVVGRCEERARSAPDGALVVF